MADERIAVVLMAWLVTAVVPAELVELPLLLTSSPIATTAAGAEESALAARLRPAKSSLAMARSAVLLVVRGVALEALLAARVTLLVAVWLAALPTKM